MRRCTSLRRKTALLLLTAILATPWAATARPGPESAQEVNTVEPAPLKLILRAWSLLRSVWTKAGCNIDPFGHYLSNTAPAEVEAGCHIDPDGLCHS